MAAEIRLMAAFLEIEIKLETWPLILEYCSFEYKKTHGNESAPFGGSIFRGGVEAFLHKGTNGR